MIRNSQCDRQSRHRGLNTTSLRGVLAISTCLTASACGLPNPPDIRTDWAQRVQALGGLTAVYPPHESVRIGQLWIADASAALDQPNAQLKGRGITSIRVSDALVPAMETKRQAQGWLKTRFPKSPTTEGADLGLSTAAFFKQPADDTMEVGALPEYDLASLNQGSVTASVPTAFASFLAGLGFTQTKSLTVAPLGLEIAELPQNDFNSVVQAACFTPNGAFAPGRTRDVMQNAAYNGLAALWEQRANDAKGAPIAKYDPYMFLIDKVFYIRGINYVYHDSNAVAAAMSAALNARIAGAANAPAAPALSVAAAPTSADMTAVAAAVNALATAISKSPAAGSNIGISTSFAHATAEGVEMTQVFDRPVAFGYNTEAKRLVAEPFGRLSGGIDGLCAAASPGQAIPPTPPKGARISEN